MSKTLAAMLLLAWPYRAASASDRAVQYSRDVRPLLSNSCFKCHGPDVAERKAGMRLDVRAEALRPAESGSVPIAPGNPAESEMLKRIGSTDPDEQMPPPDSKKPRLKAEEVELIRRWIREGANYDGHWSFTKPRRPSVPESMDSAWVRNPIDAFISEAHNVEKLAHAPEADHRTLIRRLSFDLTGLPATVEEINAFEADSSARAYEHVVERLLSSPHYGERMALFWLDMVRYADTGGYHSDNHRDISPYRDYVIAAFNANMPFDRFTTEQLAGDLLPDATTEQKIASGYNKMLMTTEEGGAQPKEYTAKYAADRVRNASSVWLGATLGCAECHDHKFDPFKTRDFYSFAAFFADVKELAVGRQEQVSLPTPEQAKQLAGLDAQISQLESEFNRPTPELAAAQQAWEVMLAQHDFKWNILKPLSAESSDGVTLSIAADGTVIASGENPPTATYTVHLETDQKAITGIRLEVLADDAFPKRGPGRAENGNFVLNEVEVTSGGIPLKLSAVNASYAQMQYPAVGAADGDLKTGWGIYQREGQDHQLVVELKNDFGDGASVGLDVRLHQTYGTSHTIGKFRFSSTAAVRPIKAKEENGLPKAVADILAVENESRSDEQRLSLAAYYRSIAPQLQDLRGQIAELKSRRESIVKAGIITLASVSVEPRVTRILPRGNWLDESGEIVQPAVPDFLPPLGVEGRRATRADLAAWMVARDNPLVARVFVNRLWKLLFGQGLVKTLDDFGSQGAWPSHPELLDWLAIELVESGWDIKHLLTLMATSNTYRQVSTPSREQREKDPANVWLARQGRFRLEAEMVRDNALAISGLLSCKVGGPSVKPYQPDGYWSWLNFPVREYHPDAGEDQYRRGLYTYWQRTFLHPSLLAFDAPTREECTVERPRSNTPLQALVLLNDPTYVECARVFAENILRAAGSTVEDRIAYAMRRAVGRSPTERELRILLSIHSKASAEYQEDPTKASELIKVGQSTVGEDTDLCELAAWTVVGRAILNLHETITRN